jgi:predicted YcjX-like family ATPase
LGLGDFTDGVIRDIEGVGARVNSALFEPSLRLGVTGLSRAGKSVFITSLVANLLERGRMPQFPPANDGRIAAVYLQPQPDDTIARFTYEKHFAALTSEAPFWPENTRNVSELRLSFRVNPTGFVAGLRGVRTFHLDIVDYPGEWLLDLALMDKSYREWSADALTRMEAQDIGVQVAHRLTRVDGAVPHEEAAIQALAEEYARFAQSAHSEGMSSGAPGRIVLPGALEGSPVLTFFPLLPVERPKRGALWREMERRYDAYRAQVVRPFFRDHFSRIDRQIVLVDVLAALHNGPKSVADLGQTMADILAGFRPGKNAWLTRILAGRRVEKILFAATKADHLHQNQHTALAGFTSALLAEAKTRAEFAGAATQAMSIAALRTTTETTLDNDGRSLECVKGRISQGAKPVAFYAGALPENPASLLSATALGRADWGGLQIKNQQFTPAVLALKAGDGLPHIRMDRAVEFLIGDQF